MRAYVSHSLLSIINPSPEKIKANAEQRNPNLSLSDIFSYHFSLFHNSDGKDIYCNKKIELFRHIDHNKI